MILQKEEVKLQVLIIMFVPPYIYAINIRENVPCTIQAKGAINLDAE